jgi:predicted Zn finger-like uncharacterized protein
MNVTCPNCATVYRVDPAKVPEAGVRARCAVCNAVFAVRREADSGRQAAPPAAASIPSPPPALHPPESETRLQPPAAVPVRAEPARSEPVRPAPITIPEPAPAPPLRPASAPPVPPPAAAPPRPLAAPPRPAPPAARPIGGAPSAPTATGASAPPKPAAPAAPARPSSAPPPAPRPVSPPVAGSTPPAARPPAPAGTRPANPFLSQDPALKARRLARALISDMVVYHPGKRQEGMRDGNLKELFEEEIKKSWEEYADQVGREVAESTSYFREALNEILAGGRQIF